MWEKQDSDKTLAEGAPSEGWIKAQRDWRQASCLDLKNHEFRLESW